MNSKNHDLDFDKLIKLATLNQTLKEMQIDEIEEIIEDKMNSINELFYQLYRLMKDERFLDSSYHEFDLNILSNPNNDNVQMLILKAINPYLNNHEYDMNYIKAIDAHSLSEEVNDQISYYLYDKEGVNDTNHIINLEKLKTGLLIDEKRLTKKH